jgi:hypothetical protein
VAAGFFVSLALVTLMSGRPGPVLSSDVAPADVPSGCYDAGSHLSATVALDPASGPAGSSFDVVLGNLNKSYVLPPPAIAGYWQGVGEGAWLTEIGSGTIPLGQDQTTFAATVPADWSPGSHTVSVCWARYKSDCAEDCLVWYMRDVTFDVTESTPTPSPTPVPLPSSFAFPPLPIFFEVIEFDPGDLNITGMEVTQGIQNAGNTVSLVDDRWTTLRVFVRGSQPRANVKVRAHFLIGGVEQLSLDAYVAMAVANPDRESMANSANFTFKTFGAPNVQFYAEVDPENERVESNETNNRFPTSGYLGKNFYDREAPRFMFVRVNYDPPNCAGASGLPNANTAASGHSWAYRTMPVPNSFSSDNPWVTRTHTFSRDLCDAHDPGWPPPNGMRLLQELASIRAVNNVLAAIFNLFGSSDIIPVSHVYGWLPGNPISYNGLGQTPGRAAFGNTQANRLDRTFTHEVGHNFNRSHLANTKIGEVGFDIVDRVTIPSTRFDYMVPAKFTSQAWVRPATWEAIFDSLDPDTFSAASADYTASFASSAQADGTAIFVSGIIDPDGTGALSSTVELPPEAPLTPSDPEGTHRIAFLDEEDAVLSTVQFAPEFAILGDDEGVEAGAVITLIADMPDGTASMTLEEVASETVLDTLTLSPNAPTVEVQFPNGGEDLAGMETFSWEALDPDGDPLSFTVLYSADGGELWEALATDITDTSLEVDTNAIPGSTLGGTEGAVEGQPFRRSKIKVIATDGLNSASDTSNGNFGVPQKPPEVFIVTPEADAHIQLGDVVPLSATILDPDEFAPLPDSAYEWSSDRDGDLGEGAFLVTQLSAGRHTISLLVTDSGGQTGSDSVQVFVGIPTYLNVEPDAVDALPLADATAHLELPFGYDIEEVDTETLSLSIAGTTLAPVATAVGDVDDDGLADLELTFDAAAFGAALPAAPGMAETMLDGELEDGTPFRGTDVVGLPLCPSAPSFGDVAGHWAYDYICAISTVGITQGCSDDPSLYCPGDAVTRAQMAAFITRALGEDSNLPTYQGYFSDVPAGAWYTGYVERLSQLEITAGCSDDPLLYCPNDEVSRAQMAVFIVRALGEEGSIPPYQGYFPDVSPSHWAAGHIERLYELGITAGKGDGTYGPNDPVSRAQMAAFITRAWVETALTSAATPAAAGSSRHVDIDLAMAGGIGIALFGLMGTGRYARRRWLA